MLHPLPPIAAITSRYPPETFHEHDTTQPALLPPGGHIEALAFPAQEALERDLPEVWDHPLPEVVACLTKYDTYEQVLANLPDIELLPR